MRDPRSSSRRSLSPGREADKAVASRSELKRLAILFGIAVGVTGFIAFFSSPGGKGREAQPMQFVNAGPDDQPALDVSPTVVPWKPPVAELNAMIREGTPEDRARIYTEALTLLGTQTRNRAHPLFKYDRSVVEAGGFDRVPPAELADPAQAARLRARPVEVVGRLGPYRPVDVSDEYGLDTREFPRGMYFEGTIVADGVEVQWLWLEESSLEFLIAPETTSWKVQGVFFRVAEVPTEEGRFVTRPVILAKKICRVVPLKLLDELPPDVAEEAARIEEERIETAPQYDLAFHKLVGYVLKKEEGAIPPEAEVRPWTTRGPIEDPDAWRLKPVHIVGVVAYLNYESYGYEEYSPLDAPAAGFWHAIVSPRDTKRNVPLSLVFPSDDLPETFETWAKATPAQRLSMDAPAIDVKGIFLRLHAFEGRGTPGSRSPFDPPAMTRLPLVVAVGVPTIVVPVVDETRGGFFVVYFIIAGVFAAVFGFLVIRDQRRGAMVEAGLRETRGKRIRARGDLSGSRPWKGPPPPA